MSAAAALGIVLVIGFVGVALVACIAWRKRMRESMPSATGVRQRRMMPHPRRSGTRIPEPSRG
jgi:hypothetical protein